MDVMDVMDLSFFGIVNFFLKEQAILYKVGGSI
jgi:hypothetical protein